MSMSTVRAELIVAESGLRIEPQDAGRLACRECGRRLAEFKARRAATCCGLVYHCPDRAWQLEVSPAEPVERPEEPAPEPPAELWRVDGRQVSREAVESLECSTCGNRLEWEQQSTGRLTAQCCERSYSLDPVRFRAKVRCR
jgi:hypothetical protein